MPEHYYVTKLLFKQFLYQATLEFQFPAADRRKNSLFDERISHIKTSIDNTLKNKYRTRISWERCRDKDKRFLDVCKISIYMLTVEDYTNIVSQYKQEAVLTKSPENHEIAQTLITGTEIEYRPHLYYHTYQYKLYLKIPYLQRDDVKKFIKQSLDHQGQSTYKFSNGDILYLNQEDFVLIKLALNECIDRIVTAKIYNIDNIDPAIPAQDRLYISNHY